MFGGPGGPSGGGNRDAKDKKNEPQKKKWEPPLPTRVGKKKKRGPDPATKLPSVYPTTRCRLKLLKNERIKDYLLLEEEFIQNQERLKPESTREEKNEDELSQVDVIRGTPLAVGTLEEIIDDEHAIVSTASGPEYYVSILSMVDKDLLEPGGTVLLHHKNQAVVGVLQDDQDPMVSVMKLDKAPTETYADIGGLESQIQEIKVRFFPWEVGPSHRSMLTRPLGIRGITLDAPRALRRDGNSTTKGCYPVWRSWNRQDPLSQGSCKPDICYIFASCRL
jgi:26S proteasome regulatory subunit T2